MPKYHIEADTDAGTFHFKKDGEHVPHSNMALGSYMTGGYNTEGNYKENSRQRIHISHDHKDEKGVNSSTAYAFYLGEPSVPNTMLTPNYGIPQAVSNLIENTIAAQNLEKVIAKRLGVDKK